MISQSSPPEEAPEPEPEQVNNPVSEDPRYARFFKMLKMVGLELLTKDV